MNCARLLRGVGVLALAWVVCASVGCNGLPKELDQPIPATREASLASLSELMNIACVSVVYIGFEGGWLVWRTQIHDPILRWETLRLKVDESLSVTVERSTKLGWDVVVTSGAAVDGEVDGATDGGEVNGGTVKGTITARAKPIQRAVFSVAEPAEAGRLKAAWLGLVR